MIDEIQNNDVFNQRNILRLLLITFSYYQLYVLFFFVLNNIILLDRETEFYHFWFSFFLLQNHSFLKKYLFFVV